jgi:ParB family transcriptional regulator, chromosome partitioning protein
MKLERIAIANLRPDPNNARTHDNANLEAIAGSLTQFGQRKPIVISKNNIVVAGNGTLAAAKSLGWTDMDVVRVPADWDDDRIKAFALADNRTAELAQWNHEVLASQLIELQEVDFAIESIGFEAPPMPTTDEWESAFDATAGDRKDVQQITFTLSTDQAETIKNALELSKSFGEFGDTGNANANGNALARICELWMGANQ